MMDLRRGADIQLYSRGTSPPFPSRLVMTDSSLFPLLHADVFLIHCFITCDVHFYHFPVDHNYLSLRTGRIFERA